METSAKSAQNIDSLMKKISQELIKRNKTTDQLKGDKRIKLVLNKQTKSKKKKCC